MTRRDLAADGTALGLIGLAVTAVFWPAALLRGAFFLQDMMVQNYPFRHLCGLAVRAGQLPTWRPEINCGFPLLAEGQAGVFYPPNLLSYLLLPTHAGLSLNIMLHCWLAGAGTYALLRAWQARRAGALAGGLAYALSGYLVVRAMSPNFTDVCAWLPVSLLGVELALTRRRVGWLLGAAAVGALQFLAGHPQAAVYSLLIVAVYAVWRAASLAAGWRWAAAGLAVPAAAALLAAMQLVPTAELVRLSVRGEGLDWERFVSMSLPPERLLTLLMPNAFGNPADGTYWGREAGFYIQLCGYVGVMPLLLALYALARARQPAAEFFGALTVAGLVLALGQYTGVFAALYRLPGMSFFRIPARFLLWSAFGISVLCGLGLDALLSNPAAGRRRRWWWAGVAALVAIAGMVWLNRDLLAAGAAAAAVRGRGFDATAWAAQLRFDAVRALLLASAGCWLVSRVPTARGRALAAAAVPALIAADLLSFGHGFNGVIDAQVYRRPPATAAAILADAGPGRVVPPRILSLVAEGNSGLDWHNGWRRDQGSYLAYPGTLRMYSAGLFGLHNTLPGWSPLHLAVHWDLMRGQSRLANLAGAEYLVRPEGCVGHPHDQVGRTWPAVCRNQTALPRAYLAETAVVVPEPAARLRYMQGDAFDPRLQVVLEKAPPAAAATARPAAAPVSAPARSSETAAAATAAGDAGQVAPGTATITAYAPTAVEVSLDECRGGFLVLSDTHYPGWQAWVDGRPAPVLRANHAFRAVPVPSGASKVRFEFHSRTLALGLAVSAVAWTAWAAALVWLHRTGRRGTGPTPREPAAGRRLGLGVWVAQAALVLVIHGIVTRWPLWAGCLERCRALGTGG